MSGLRKIRIRINDAAKLRSIAESELPRGTLSIASGQTVPAGTEVEVTLVLPDKTTTAVLTGAIAPSSPGNILIRVAEVQPAVRIIETFLRSVSNEERRADARVQTRVRVRLKYADAQQLDELYTKEVSRGGLFVPTASPIPVGTIVEILLMAPGGEFALRGAVVHHQPRAGQSGMGIIFDESSLEVRSQIGAFLAAAVRAPQEDNRRSTRVAARLSIRLRPKTMRRFSEMIVNDLSQGGTFVATNKSYAVGTKVSIGFVPPSGGAEVRIDANVVRVVTMDEAAASGGQAGMGLKFEPATPEQQGVIDAVLAAALESAPDGTSDEAKGSRPPADVARPTSPQGFVGANRRTTPRVDTTTPVVVTAVNTGTVQTLRTRDLSKGGAFIMSEAPLPAMSQIQITIAPPGKAEGLTIMADVVHVVRPADCKLPTDTAGMGVRFRNVTAEQLRFLSEFLETLAATGAELALPTPTEEERPLFTALAEFEITAVRPNYYGVLGIPPTATAREIELAVNACYARIDPPEALRGKLSPFLAGRTQRMRDILTKIVVAFGTPERRAAYDASIGIRTVVPFVRPPPPSLTAASASAAPVAGGAGKSPQQRRAEEFFVLAQTCLDNGDRGGAMRNLQLATTFDPGEERFRNLLRELRNK